MPSAAFTINGVAAPQASGIAFTAAPGSTVTLALSDPSGVNSISWDLSATSWPGISLPVVSVTGTPIGKNASFVMPSLAALPALQGISFGVKCTVVGSDYSVSTAYGVVGVENTAGFVPGAVGEEDPWRHATHGWLPLFNTGLQGGPCLLTRRTMYTATPTVIASIPMDLGTVAAVTVFWFAWCPTGSKRFVHEERAMFERVSGGTVSILGSASSTQLFRTDAAWSTDIGPGTGAIDLAVTSDATTTQWEVAAWKRVGRVM